MKSFSLLVFFLISNHVFSAAKLTATPINSPVKEAYLKVKLDGFPSITGVSFKPKNGGDEVEGIVEKDGNNFIGKFKASFLKPGTYDYRVKIRTSSGQSSNENAASVDFINFSIDPSLEVADPGDEGKKTLLGIDTDNDGVRNDIQRLINETYPTKESTKKALKQMAVAMNQSLENANDKNLSNQYSHDIGYAIACIAWIDGGAGFIEKEKYIRKNFYNTAMRIQQKMLVDNNFHGQGTGPREKALKSSSWNTLCNFPATQGN